jgi:lipopolysaccharide transport protein LptA
MVGLRNNILILYVAVAGGSVFAQEATTSADSDYIDLEYDSLLLDRESNMMRFVGFRLSTGNIRIEADEAMAHSDNFEFDHGAWELEGNVSILVDSASIRAASAAFEFLDQELVTGELEGSPVVFEDAETDREGPVFGTASRIYYDHTEQTVRLTGDVSLTAGRAETTGCDLIYFLDGEDFTTGPTECEVRSTMTILPKEEGTSADGDPANP